MGMTFVSFQIEFMGAGRRWKPCPPSEGSGNRSTESMLKTFKDREAVDLPGKNDIGLSVSCRASKWKSLNRQSPFGFRLKLRVADLALNQNQTLETNIWIRRHHLWLCYIGDKSQPWNYTTISNWFGVPNFVTYQNKVLRFVGRVDIHIIC